MEPVKPLELLVVVVGRSSGERKRERIHSKLARS
jgi:hypothetical protein